jgi:replication factor C subunit 2/4
MNINWIEKYRPNKLNDITAQEHIIKPLESTLLKGQLPHLLFYGPAGCGKTSTILALCKQMFGKDWKNRVYEFNASDERGINVIRDKIKNYAKRSIINSKVDENHQYKIIILDEADIMTNESQFALRRIIEQNSNVTRFCIICNYMNKIIDPIVSRCAKFRFYPLLDEQIKKKLILICKNEKVKYTSNILDRIIELSKGDMRQAINFLQQSVNVFSQKLEINLIQSISSHIPKEIIVNIINISLNDNTNLVNFIKNIVKDGYSAYHIITESSDYINNTELIYDKQKALINIKMANVIYHLTNSCDEEIQLLRFYLYISHICKSTIKET